LKESILAIIVFTILFVRCTSSISPNSEIHATLYSASDLAIFNNQLIVAGTSHPDSNTLAIKSPYLLTLDSSLNIYDTRIFKTETTASNVIFKALKNNEYALAFYGAKSLQNQQEQTQIFILDQDLLEEDNQIYGTRTRIRDLTEIGSDLISLNYERTDQTMSLRSNKKFDIKIEEGAESSIPTDILVTPEKEIFILGIANGFHYLDGHNYEEQFAYGFIRKYNSSAKELNKFNYKESGHTFFSDMLYHDEILSVMGTKQKSNSGMDILLLQFDNELNLLREKSFPKKGIQEGSTIEYFDNSIYIFGTTEDLSTHKLSLELSCLNVDGNIIWQQSFGDPKRSYSAIDMILFDSNIILLSQSVENRISTQLNHLHKVSLSGDLIKEVQLN